MGLRDCLIPDSQYNVGMNTYSENNVIKLVQAALEEGIQEFAVGAGIMMDNQILIVFRSQSENFLPGYAQLPSGGVDKGESVITALKREVKEETGLYVSKILEYSGCFDYVSESGRKSRQFNFLVVTTNYDIQLNPLEHSHYLWLSSKDTHFSKVLITPEMKKSIIELFSMNSPLD